MAKKSDFAQKLLDDIRRRKEKLGYVSASSPQSSSLELTQAAGVNVANMKSQNTFQHSGGIRIKSEKNLVGPDALWFDMRNNRYTPKENTSQAIVPVGTNKNVQNSIDVSMALGLLLSYSGKLQNAETLMPNRIKNDVILRYGSLYFNQNNDTKTLNKMKFHAGVQHPSSNLQVTEISKGVQNLNKILEMWTRRMQFDYGSTEVGKELLKGAIDLEESLRMLMTLQEVSDYMVSSHGDQVKLLKLHKEEDRNSSKESEKKVKDESGFSFVRTPKYLQKTSKEGIYAGIEGQKKLTLNHQNKIATVKKTNKSYLNSSFQFIPHQQSLSSNSSSTSDSHCNSITTKQAQTKESMGLSYSYYNCSDAKSMRRLDYTSGYSTTSSEKVRIPNVIAKLMGLEELPSLKSDVRRGETQHYPKPNKGIVTYQCLKADRATKKEARISQTNFAKNGRENKVLQEKQFPPHKAEKMLEVTHTREKANLTCTFTTNKMNEKSFFEAKSHSPLKNHSEICKSDCRLETKKSKINVEKFTKKRNKKDQKQQVGTIFQVAKKTSLQKQLNQTKESSQEHDTKFINRDESSESPESQKHFSSPSTDQIKHPNKVAQYKTSHQKHCTYGTSGNKALSSSKNMIHNKQVSEDIANKQHQNEGSKINHKENQIMRNRNSISRNLNVSGVGGRLECSKLKSKTDPTLDQTDVLQALVTFPDETVDYSSVKKVDTTNHRVNKDQYCNTSGIEAQYTEKTDTECQQAGVLNRLDHGSKERTCTPEQITELFQDRDFMYHREIQVASLPSSNIFMDAHRIENQAEETKVASNCTSNMEENTSVVVQHEEISKIAEPELSLQDLNDKETQGPIIELLDNELLTSETTKQVLLNKKQHPFAQKLSHDKHFIDEVQAIFMLKLQFHELESSDIAFAKDESKLLLDFGLELIRRKGKRAEITNSKPKSYHHMRNINFESLIKELIDDLEYLEGTCKSTYINDDNGEFLHSMIDQDLQNRKPDITCMWDHGWNNTVFAEVEKYEVSTELEKQLLNMLINELVGDLLTV